MSEAQPGRSESLSLSFDVDCAIEHAFAVWTQRINTWWPSDHTVTGRLDAEVILEPRVGGRLFERTPDGDEYDWGQVTVWEPPSRLGYRWHLMRERADATQVDIRFRPHGSSATRIDIEHRGWDGPVDPWRERNLAGWQTLLPSYLNAVVNGDQ